MPKPFPLEFRRDVVAVARQGEQSRAKVARSSGVSESCLNPWMMLADRDDGITPPKPDDNTADSAGTQGTAQEEPPPRAGERDPTPSDGLLRPGCSPKMMFPRKREVPPPLALDLAADGIPVMVTCRVPGSTRQAFYKWAADPVTDGDWSDTHLVNEAIDHDDPDLGYRFIADELVGRGVVVSRNRVQRLSTLAQLWSAHARRRGRQRRPGPPVHADLIRRRFRANRANEVWLTDSRRLLLLPSSHPTDEGKLYLCAVKDAFSNRIVGCFIDARMTAQFAVNALDNAIALRGVAGALSVIVHSDRGSQFRSHSYVRALSSVNARGSMGRVGTSADNAAMELFFSLLQKNVLNRRTWKTRQELRSTIVTWIEATYHRRRRQQTLGRLTPIGYETLHQTAHAA